MNEPKRLIITGLVIFFIGISAPIIMMCRSISGNTQFTVPGNIELTISEAGTYYLWNDYVTNFHGRFYKNSNTIPHGTQVALSDKTSGKESLMEYASMAWMSGTQRSNAVGYFELQPGTYTLRVSGNFPERVFSFGPGSSYGSTVSFSLVSIVIALAGLMTAIIQFEKLRHARFGLK